MPQLDLTETEAKLIWLALERLAPVNLEPAGLTDTWLALFPRVYRAYRGMPMPSEATS